MFSSENNKKRVGASSSIEPGEIEGGHVTSFFSERGGAYNFFYHKEGGSHVSDQRPTGGSSNFPTESRVVFA